MEKQVFQTSDVKRWMRFRWTMRTISFILILLVAALVVMLFIEKNPRLPFNRNYRSIISASKPYLQENKLSKEYRGFRDFIKDKKIYTNYAREKQNRNKQFFYSKSLLKNNSLNNFTNKSWQQFPAGIRSAFYVAWDPQSLFSLKKNIANLNLVIPEWFFIDPKADTVRTDMDPAGYEVMKKSGVPIMPILSNNFDREFRSDALSRILHDPKKRKTVIDNVLNQCLQHHFIGVNIDFEDINENSDEYLIQFIKEMAQTFHAKGLLVTQDIMPFNNDYNVSELAKYNDYLFLMAYDEHSSDGKPGPISSQKWIEAAVDDLAKKIPNEKIILGLGAYGYDWPAKEGVDPAVTYQQALSRANASKASIDYNNDTYNLSFSYIGNDNVTHDVYFTDAATQFNSMRFGSPYGLAGFALWRLGSEDNRLWKYYASNLSNEGIKNFKFNVLENVSTTNDVDYVGDGEILDVLNTPHQGKIHLQIDSVDNLISEQQYIQLPSAYQVQKYGQGTPKQLVLTFDDGPDDRWTPNILNTLSKYHVPAAFFVLGLQSEKNLPILKREYKEGHEIGNHTFTHQNIAKISPDRAKIELKLTRILIESVTGSSTILFRAPYNADSEPSTMEEIIPVALARKQNYLDIGENIDPEDWEEGITSQEIVKRVLDGVHEGRGNIILLHDAGGETRQPTVDALPIIIQTLQKEGYQFTNLATLLGKTKDELMPPVPKGSGFYIMQFNLVLATAIYWFSNFFYALFLIFVFLGLLRLIIMVILMLRERKREKNELKNFIEIKDFPLVSIIVPAYNEEVNAVSSIKNLLQQDYPNFNIIFIDDGSKDNTFQLVSEAFVNHPVIKIFTKPNGGKASALNYGISQTSADYIVCIDADTKLYPDAVSKLMLHFLNPINGKNIGAVAGNVKVGNEVNLLTKWQAIEYTTSQNFDRRAYANINAITVVPGAIGGFRREAIEKAGGFTTDTLAEDCDLTIRILRTGYIIENENNSIAITEAPEKTKQFIKQRTRWSFGVMQTFWKHRDTLFNKKYKGLGFWAIPNILIFQFIIPFFSPLADLFMIFGLFSGNAVKIGIYYGIFMLVDISISVVAFIFEKEKPFKLIWLIPQRFVYRWIMYVVLFKSFLKAIKGELQQWGVLKRTGNVKDIQLAVKL